jgi:hypothetical protein
VSAKLTGGCLCGQVRFEVDGDAGPFFLCHCSHCRRDTGSAHAANLFVAPGQLDWLAGQERVTRFDLPGTRHTRCFCSTCGSALPYVRPGGAGLVVPAGSLHGPVGLRPTAHIFAASRADWDHALEQLPFFDGLPT